MGIDKYEVIRAMEIWLENDEECSGYCEKCDYERICNNLERVVPKLQTIFKLKK